MSVFSKMYGYPTGYFNTIYKYLLNDGQIKTENDLINLVKDFGYPPEIINKLAQEIICTDGLNIPDVVENWGVDLQLDKEPDEDVEMNYNENKFIMNGGDNSDNENNIDKNDSQESVDSESFDDSNETSGLNSDDSEM